MFQHTLCVYPYRKDLKRFGFFPPLGLEYIGAVTEPYTQSIDIIDLRKEPGHTADFLKPETDVVCFSVNWDRDAEFILKEIRSVPANIFTILGGRHVTNDPEVWFQSCPNVDVIVRGDGEEVMDELCRGRPLEEIEGLSFRKNGDIIHNSNRHLGPMRDDLMPNRKLRRYSYDVEVEEVGIGVKFDTMSASRGCPFSCTFCALSRNPWGVKRDWTGRSAESIVKELEQIDASVIAFTDDLFTHNMNRVEQICDLIIARGIRKKLIINARLEAARRPDVLRKMEQAGFVLLLLGIESAHDKTLKSMHKGFNTAKVREYFDVLRDRDMIMHGYFILGNIGESAEEMQQVSSFAHELGVDTISLMSLVFNPWSGLEELVAENPGYHIAPNGKIYSNQCSLTGLRKLRKRINREFYTRRQIFRILGKSYRSGMFSLLPETFLHIPKITYAFVMKTWKKKKRRARRKKLLANKSNGQI